MEAFYCPEYASNPSHDSNIEQRAVSGNFLDHSAIRAGPQWWETTSSQWQCLRPLSYQGSPQCWETANSQWQRLRPHGHQDRPPVVWDSDLLEAMLWTTQPSGQPSVVRDSYQSVAIPWTTQPSGQALSCERQLAVSGNTLDHSAIRAGPQLWETASSKWQRFRPLNHQGRPSVERDSEQSVATP